MKTLKIREARSGMKIGQAQYAGLCCVCIMHHLIHHSSNEVDIFVPDHLNTQLTMDEINEILDLPASTFFELASNEHTERKRYAQVIVIL